MTDIDVADGSKTVSMCSINTIASEKFFVFDNYICVRGQCAEFIRDYLVSICEYAGAFQSGKEHYSVTGSFYVLILLMPERFDFRELFPHAFQNVTEFFFLTDVEARFVEAVKDHLQKFPFR